MHQQNNAAELKLGNNDPVQRALLEEFSQGKVSYRKVMRNLRIDNDEDLFLMMASANFPMPSLNEEETKEMMKNFDKVLHAAGL